MYDGIDEGIVDGGGLCYDCRDSLGVWRQDVGVTKRERRIERIRTLHKVDVFYFPTLLLYLVT